MIRPEVAGIAPSEVGVLDGAAEAWTVIDAPAWPSGAGEELPAEAGPVGLAAVAADAIAAADGEPVAAWGVTRFVEVAVVGIAAGVPFAVGDFP